MECFSVITCSMYDPLFLYTNSVTEAENRDKKLNSEEKLINCLATVKNSEPVEIIMNVARDVQSM